jgi:thiamine-phosphate pyrophosphorylase
MMEHGVTLFQYRSKFKKKNQKIKEILCLLELIRSKKGTFIINDDVNLARDTKADGVHLGENDMPLNQARSILGNDFIIGISCYDSITKALNMQKLGADYVAFGSCFATKTKFGAKIMNLNILENVGLIKIPKVLIGGINLQNLDKLLKYDFDCVAISQALFQSSDIKNSLNRFFLLLNNE